MISPKPPSDKATPTGILWFLLTLSVVVILGMAGAWAHSLQSQQEELGKRVTVLESQWGAVVVELHDLREENKTMQTKLDRLLEKK